MTATLPAMHTLLGAVREALIHHVEVQPGRSGLATVRLGGYEMQLRLAGEPPEAVLGKVCDSLAEAASFGLATALTDESSAGTQLRMELVAALATVEATVDHAGRHGHASDGTELLTTAEVAAALGMSRPYVSMLCDQGLLGEVSRSQGGHRRIRRDAVTSYLQRQRLAAGASG